LNRVGGSKYTARVLESDEKNYKTVDLAGMKVDKSIIN
jgi:hypothetical protein